MDIAFVSACFGDHDVGEYWEFIYPTVNRYCEKYKIDFYLYKEKLGDKNRTGRWSKIPAVRNHIDDYDWVMWIDADIMIMNHMIDIRDYIKNSYKFIATSFDNSNHLFDTGLFFIKGNEFWSKNFLDEVYSGENYYANNPHKEFYEQSSIELYFENNDDSDVLLRKPTIHKIWPLEIPDITDFHLNPSSDSVEKFWREKDKNFFHKGDFCVHMTGRSMEKRKKDYKLLSNHVLWHS